MGGCSVPFTGMWKGPNGQEEGGGEVQSLVRKQDAKETPNLIPNILVEAARQNLALLRRAGLTSATRCCSAGSDIVR